MTSRLIVIRGTTRLLPIDLVDSDGLAFPRERLVGASAEFLMRVLPTDMSNVLRYATGSDPLALAFDPLLPVLNLTFLAADTASTTPGPYYWQVELTLAGGEVFAVVPWDVLDLDVGGSASQTPPVFNNTVAITSDFVQDGSLTYVTAGGSPIAGAQVRVYNKADYDAGLLDKAVGITTTDDRGRMTQPVLVTPGYMYLVRFDKPYEYGPDLVTFFA